MNGDKVSSHLLGCLIGFIVAVLLVIWFIWGARDFL